MPDRPHNPELAWTAAVCLRAAAVRLRNCFLVLIFMAGTATSKQAIAAAAPPALLEYEVKAAFLLNFTKFVDWPGSEAPPDTPFTLCIAGDDPFGRVLDQTVQGEKVGRRPLRVQRLGHTAPVLGACQMLYVSRSEKEVKELLSGLGSGVLTIGEDETFTRAGGMIAFVLENRRVRFVINLSATRNAMLTLSSRLLAVAKSVGR